jgi:arylsulfatase A-like enzyme
MEIDLRSRPDRLRSITAALWAASAVLLSGCSSSTSTTPTTTAKTESRTPLPNILLVIADDVGKDLTTNAYPGLIDDLVKQYGPSGHNHPNYQNINGKPASTPVLNKLSSEGMRFSAAWSHPYCSPTRAAIITGLHAAKTNVTTYADPLSSKHTTFVQKLRDEAGYSTAIFGKWHLAGMTSDYPGMKPKQAGFDLFKGNLNAAINSYWSYDYHVQDSSTPADQWRTDPMPTKSLPGIAATNYAPVVKVADALEWIAAREKENPDKPWFVWMAYNLSHITAVQQPYGTAVPNADTLDTASYNEIRNCGGTFGTNKIGVCSGQALMRAMTNSLDTVLGKLLDGVDALDSNTYVIFIGDNGTAMYGRTGQNFIDNMYITRNGRGKGTAYESGALVPMVIRGPKITANTQSKEFVHATDLFSTILELANLTPPKSVSNSAGNGLVWLDSVSLVPILLNKAQSVRDPSNDYILAESTNPLTGGTRMVGARNATHKVVCTESADNCAFYNLINDPLEEYPLNKPASCADYTKWMSADPQWNYCRLVQAVAEDSFLSTDPNGAARALSHYDPEDE